MKPQGVWAFVLASSVLILVPGVDMALVTRQVVMHGRRVAFATLPGLLTAGLAHAMFATAGLSALLLASATAYTTLKAVGAVYLLILGVQTLWATRRRAPATDHGVVEAGSRSPQRQMGLRRAYLLGLTSNLTNPKMAVFFLTFIPQFVPPGPHAAAHTARLGLLFNAMATSFWVGYVLVLGRISAWLDRLAVRRALQRTTGTVLVGIGLRLAVERR
jgi:threonine/homoserine/homoserine lactone efflux protein